MATNKTGPYGKRGNGDNFAWGEQDVREDDSPLTVVSRSPSPKLAIWWNEDLHQPLISDL